MRKILLTIGLIVSFNTAVVAQNKLLHDLGISLNLLLAGFFGALLLVRKEGKTWKDNVLTLVTGSFSAAYLAPFITETLNFTTQSALTFVGFVVGFGSIKIVEFLMEKYFKTQSQDDKSN